VQPSSIGPEHGTTCTVGKVAASDSQSDDDDDELGRFLDIMIDFSLSFDNNNNGDVSDDNDDKAAKD